MVGVTRVGHKCWAELIMRSAGGLRAGEIGRLVSEGSIMPHAWMWVPGAPLWCFEGGGGGAEDCGLDCAIVGVCGTCCGFSDEGAGGGDGRCSSQMLGVGCLFVEGLRSALRLQSRRAGCFVIGARSTLFSGSMPGDLSRWNGSS